MKAVVFCGQSLKVLKRFPDRARREAGHQLDRLQRGLDPIDWKPMTSIGKGVREIRIRHQGQYRVIYVLIGQTGVHVLHAFNKKTQKTRRKDLLAAKQAFAALKTGELK